MRYRIPEPALFLNNRAKLTKELPENAIVVMHSNDEMPRNGDQTFAFRQLSDLFYLTGLDQEKTILVMAPRHPDKALREMVFTIKTNDEMVTWNGYRFTKEQVSTISGVNTVFWLEEFDFQLRNLMLWAKRVFLIQNEYPKFTTEVETQNDRFIAAMKEKYPLHKYHRLAPIMKKLRTKKEPQELAMMQQACDITKSAFNRVMNKLCGNMMEYEIEAEMTYEFIRQGSTGHAYSPIVASGQNACILHYIDNDQPCHDGDLLLMDFGAEYGNYAADCSRTIPVNGKFTARQKQCYEAVLRVQKEAIKLFIPGNTIKIVNDSVNLMIEQEMIGLELFTQDQVDNQDPQNPLFKKYYMHGTSHFLGLDVHDVGDLDMPFEAGMVLTCEPGIYIPEENIGIRIEDDIVVADSPRNLMADIPKEVDEIEKIMANRQ